MVFCVIRRKPYHLFWIGEEGMKASFDVTLSPKDLYRFNMYQTYTGFQGWSSIALGILGFVMAGISFQNGKTSYTLLYIAVGFLRRVKKCQQYSVDQLKIRQALVRALSF